MQDDTDNSPLRDTSGRFQPGRSGNPAGKKPGTRNRATLLTAALRDGEESAIARVVIDKALGGNSAAARFVIGLLVPRLRGRTIALNLLDGDGAETLVGAANATVRAMAAGEISPEEALTVMRVLDLRVKVVKTAARTSEVSPWASSEPSPVHGRAQGEGLGAPAEQDLHDLCAQPSPRPSPASGRGGLVEMRSGRRFAHALLHSTCISTPSAIPPSLTGWRRAA